MESAESVVLVCATKAVRSLIASAICWGVKAASVPWVIRRAEKMEAMVESNMTIARLVKFTEVSLENLKVAHRVDLLTRRTFIPFFGSKI